MTAIKKVKDKEGTQFFPVTHERAVRDDNGTTLETKLQNIDSTITNLADEEDIMQYSNGKLSLKDRGTTDGMGYIILRKNKTFASQVTKADTIYEIRYDFTLDSDVTMPANCVLKFEGGSLSGEVAITANNTEIQAGLFQIFTTEVALTGTWNVSEAYPEWFGAKGDGGTDDTQFINKCLDCFNNVHLCSKKSYNVTQLVVFDGSVVDGHNGILIYTGTSNLLNIGVAACTIKNLRIYVPDEDNASAVFNFTPASYNGTSKLKNISDVLIYADNRTNTYKSKVTGFLFSPNIHIGSGGVSGVIANNCQCKNIDTFCKIVIPEETTAAGATGWVNNNHFTNCMAYYCGCVLDFTEGTIIGNVFDIDYQRANSTNGATEDRPVFSIPYYNDVTRNSIKGYIWDTSTATSPYLSPKGYTPANIRDFRCYCSANEAILLGFFPNNKQTWVKVELTFLNGSCSFIVKCINGTVNVADPIYVGSTAFQFIINYRSKGDFIEIHLYVASGNPVLGVNFSCINGFSIAELQYTLSVSSLGGTDVVVPNTTTVASYPCIFNENAKRITIPIKAREFESITQTGLYFFSAQLKQLAFTTIDKRCLLTVQCVDGVYHILNAVSDDLEAVSQYFISRGEQGPWLIKSGVLTREQIDVTKIKNGSTIYEPNLGQLIRLKDSVWVNMDGVPLTNVTSTRGTTAIRESLVLSANNEGLKYYDTTLHKYVLWNGTAWVNLDGTSLSTTTN